MKAQPSGRCGTPNNMAAAVLYLANASEVTAVVLPVGSSAAAGGNGLNRRKKAL
jgi:hypothetical protein